MTDPPRLKSLSSGDIVHHLLASTEDDGPPLGASARVLAALGAGGAVATSAGAARASALAAKAKAVTVVVVAKWMGLGAATAFVTLGTLAVAVNRFTSTKEPAGREVHAVSAPASPAARHDESVVPASTASATTAEPVANVTKPALTRTEATPAVAHPATDVELAKRLRTTSTAPDVVAAPVAPSDLSLEVSSLDEARKSLASGDANAALRQLDAYGTRFPHAALAPEATVLRVQSLLRAGERRRAEELARAFIAASPGSPHAARLRLLIEGHGNAGVRLSDQSGSVRSLP